MEADEKRSGRHIEAQRRQALVRPGRGLDGRPDHGDIADQYHRLDAARDGRVNQGPIEEAGSRHRHDDAAERRALSLMD